MTLFTNFADDLRVAIIGSSGGIGFGLVELCVNDPKVKRVHALSRMGVSHPSPKVSNLTFDFLDEGSIKAATTALNEVGPIDIVIVASGFLHDENISPEKSMRSLSYEAFIKNFEINTIGPAMTAKHFLPLLRRDQKAVFAALSARVGSISDNRLGGWYAYRAAKVALNMVIQTLSIEYARRFKKTVIIGLHPGTVDTGLSEPFQKNVPDGKLFTPEFSAQQLLKVINEVEFEDSGHLFAWDGTKVPA